MGEAAEAAIDRLAPRRRPPGRAAGYQCWRNLLFAHWAVPAQIVRPLVPFAFELDLWQGSCFVGLVPFRMQSVRPAWWPKRAGIDFLETNLRTYVTYQQQPGVYFFSLEADSRPAVWAARLGWALPYHHAQMALTQRASSFSGHSRRTHGGAGCEFDYEVGESLGPSLPDSLEFFLLERYLLFAMRGSRVLTGQVHHRPYPVERATVRHCAESLFAAARLPSANGLPLYAHYSTGVDVEVFNRP